MEVEKKKMPKWAIVVIIVLVICIIGGLTGGNNSNLSDDSNDNNNQEEQQTDEVTETIEENEDTQTVEETIPTEYRNALNQADTYANVMHMSKQGIYDQLTFEYGGQFPNMQ